MHKRIFFLSLGVVLLLMACNLSTGGQSTPIAEFPTPQLETQTAIAAPPEEEAQPSPTPQPELDLTQTESPKEPGPESGELIYQTGFTDLVEIANNWLVFPWWKSSVITEAGADFKPRTNEIPYEIKNNALHVEVPKFWTNVALIHTSEDVYDDVALLLDTRLVHDPRPTYVSAICRYTEAGWYEFYINYEGEWGIMRVDVTADSYENAVELVNGESDAIMIDDLKAENQLLATCQGDTLAMTVNDQFLGQAVDDIYVAGWFGVGVATGVNGNSRMEFENLEVRVP
jgi:hypothetical protein